jgi:hypothetical protein
MAYNAIKNFIMGRMGYPRVKVYITEEQLDDCIWEAMSFYFEYRDDIIRESYISGTAYVGEYTLPPTIVPKYIHNVIFKPTDPLFSLTGVMQDVYLLYYLQNAGGAANFIVDYWMTLANYKEYERVLGNQPHWEIINGNVLKLDPTPSIDFQIGIRYMALPDETTIENTRWIRLFALACAKQVEGEIREKFSTLQAGSGEISLNGAALKAEAEVEKQRLWDENYSKQLPLGMLFG